MSELSLIGAVIGGGLAIIGVGVGIGLIGFAAMSGIARQPKKSGTIKRNMAVLAFIIIGLSAIPLSISLSTVGFAQDTPQPHKPSSTSPQYTSPSSSQNNTGTYLGVGLIILAAAGSIAVVGQSTMRTMARIPEKAGDVRMTMIVLVALIEGLALFGLVIVLLVAMGLKL